MNFHVDIKLKSQDIKSIGLNRFFFLQFLVKIRINSF